MPTLHLLSHYIDIQVVANFSSPQSFQSICLTFLRSSIFPVLYFPFMYTSFISIALCFSGASCCTLFLWSCCTFYSCYALFLFFLFFLFSFSSCSVFQSSFTTLNFAVVFPVLDLFRGLRREKDRGEEIEKEGAALNLAALLQGQR